MLGVAPSTILRIRRRISFARWYDKVNEWTKWYTGAGIHYGTGIWTSDIPDWLLYEWYSCGVPPKYVAHIVGFNIHWPDYMVWRERYGDYYGQWFADFGYDQMSCGYLSWWKSYSK